MNKIMNKIIKGAIAALTAMAGISTAVTPVMAETATEHTVVIQVDGKAGTQYPFAFNVSSAYNETPATTTINFQVLSGDVTVVGDITEITLAKKMYTYNGTGHFIITGSGKIAFTLPSGLNYSSEPDGIDGQLIPYTPSPFKSAADSTNTHTIVTQPYFLAYYRGIKLTDTEPANIMHHWEIDEYSSSNPHNLIWNFQDNYDQNFYPSSEFTSVEIDETELNTDEYETESSIGFNVSIKSNKLSTLAAGSHRATFKYGSNQVSSDFTVLNAPAPTPASTNYTPVSGGSVLTLNKYLIMRRDASVPETTINFAIQPGTAIPAGNGKFEVLAGVGTPTASSITYSAADTASKQDTVTPGDTVVLDSDMSYVKKSVIVDFSSVSFDEPGVYRYMLTEACNDEATFIDMDVQTISGAVAKQRVLDVYVIDDGNGNLVVDSYVLHEILGDIAAGADMGTDVESRLSDKSDGFVNRVMTYNLEVGNNTEGNEASRDKYFDYTLALTGLQPNHTYTVDISRAHATSGSNAATIAANSGQTNPAEITTDATGAATVHYFLNDSEYVMVQGLPRNASYQLSANAEDYKQTEGTTDPVNRAKVHDDPVSGEFATLLSDQYTGMTHTRNGIVPTGVFAGAAGALALIVFAFIFLMGKKRTAYDD